MDLLNRFPVDHVVVLMLENRSYDHMLGYVPNGRGLTGDEFNLVNPSDPASERVRVSNRAGYITTVDTAHDFISVETLPVTGEPEETRRYRELLRMDSLEKWRWGEVDQSEMSQDALSSFQGTLVTLAQQLN